MREKLHKKDVEGAYRAPGGIPKLNIDVNSHSI